MYTLSSKSINVLFQDTLYGSSSESIIMIWYINDQSKHWSLSFPGIPVNYNDVASIDPEYAKNLQVRTKTQDFLLINHVFLVTCNHFLLVSHVLLVNHILLVNHVLLINRVLIIG